MDEQAYSEARERMVREQLQARGIVDTRVLDALRRVPRHLFVPKELAERAYADRALPIGNGQTISQPYMVASIAQTLELRGHERVLDVGTGSGYQAAVLAELAAQVVSIERHESLAVSARQTLLEAGYSDVAVVVGDGTQGYAANAPYDAIAVAAGSPQVPSMLVAQLASPGRLALPVGTAAAQRLTVLIKDAQGQITTRTLEECQFVPLIGEQGWKE